MCMKNNNDTELPQAVLVFSKSGLRLSVGEQKRSSAGHLSSIMMATPTPTTKIKRSHAGAGMGVMWSGGSGEVVGGRILVAR
ncbi:MAG: hypothetical protein JWM47_4117 [Acidimicrobiales bacterium]|nr:hypothetical protein [Acidimicrobiales bacterium]